MDEADSEETAADSSPDEDAEARQNPTASEANESADPDSADDGKPSDSTNISSSAREASETTTAPKVAADTLTPNTKEQHNSPAKTPDPALAALGANVALRQASSSESNAGNPAGAVKSAATPVNPPANNSSAQAKASVRAVQNDADEQSSSTDALDAESSADSDSTESSDSPSATPVATPQAAPAGPAEPASAAPVAATVDQSSLTNFAQSLAGTTSPIAPGPAASTSAQSNAPASNSARFIAENHPAIVQSVKTELLPNGGTMKLRLDPPELGAMQVSVHVKDGVVTASFETSNEQATKMLSHSLGQLKQALESQGITVGKMHVQQAPKNQTSDDRSQDSDSDADQSRENTSSSQQDAQRRETLRRMWEKLALGGDPLDMVA